MAAGRRDRRPVIAVAGGSLSANATAGERAIIAAGFQVYVRSGSNRVVAPVVEVTDASHGRQTKVARLAYVDSPFMRDLLCRAARWERFDLRQQCQVEINPPGDVAPVILSPARHCTFPQVMGVITTPTLRPDGSILSQPGYDVATRLLLVDPPAMPEIPTSPSRDEALAALALIDDLFNEFPFCDAASRSVALSAALTPIARGAFACAPAHAVTAPERGTGKSYLFDVAAAIAMGQPCPVQAAGRNEEETEKRLGAALIAGQQIICIDNVNGELGGDFLCQMIERPVVDVRVLGKSEQVRVEARTTTFLNGNNLVLVNDMTRRVLLSRMDARLERPELRQFRGDPVETVLSNRGLYIAAALTVLRGYLAAGQPDRARRLLSFGGWSDLVRSALIWLGRADPCDTMEQAVADDPVRTRLRNVLSAWRDALGVGRANAVTAASLLTRLDEREYDDAPFTSRDRPYRHPALREAVMVVGARQGHLEARGFGTWLSRNRDRTVSGLLLCSESDEHGHAALWWVEERPAA